jgi:hypothetical protein
VLGKSGTRSARKGQIGWIHELDLRVSYLLRHDSRSELTSRLSGHSFLPDLKRFCVPADSFHIKRVEEFGRLRLRPVRHPGIGVDRRDWFWYGCE